MRRAGAFRTTCSLIALVLSGNLTAGAGEGLDGRVAESRSAYVRKLESLATWCGESQLALERDLVYGRILRVSPDHARARSALKYVRDPKTQAWKRQAYTAPKNWNKGLLATAKKRREEAFAPYRDAVLAALEAAGESVASGVREEAFESLVDLEPDDATLRSSRGDVEHDGHWLLPESVEALKRREEFAVLRVRLRAEAPEPGLDDKGVKNGWRAAVTTGAFSVWSDDGAEARTLVILMEQSRAFLRHALGAEPRPYGLTALLLPTPEAAKRWLSEQGGAYAKARREADVFSSVWLPGGSLLCYIEDKMHRSDSVLRQTLSVGVKWRWKSERDRGWISEGLEQRICWHLAGRHGPPFANMGHTETVPGREEESLPDRTQPWLGAAARTLETDAVRRIRALLTRHLNAMEGPDVLAAYALGAYLLEGRPEAIGPLVQATHAHDDADRQTLEALGVDAATLAWRVRRWVLEAARLEGE